MKTAISYEEAIEMLAINLRSIVRSESLIKKLIPETHDRVADFTVFEAKAYSTVLSVVYSVSNDVVLNDLLDEKYWPQESNDRQ